MSTLTKILLPVDFSESSVVAARHAAAIARHFQAEVMLLHVNEISVLYPPAGPLDYGISNYDAVMAEYKDSRKALLDSFARDELEGVRARRVVCSGDPAKVIVDVAHSEQVDLILMPTHGYGPFRRFLLGSVTAKVLHDALCPVWTGVHLRADLHPDPTAPRRVLCAVNFGPRSPKVIQWAADYAAKFGAKLTLVHAILEVPPEIADRYKMSWHEEARWGTDERLHLLLRELEIDAGILIVDGDAPRALGEAVTSQAADLLVIGRSSASLPAGRLSNRTYGIICHSPSPVVSV
jgi:nucleotide-binding universal stress UspA family protein